MGGMPGIVFKAIVKVSGSRLNGIANSFQKGFKNSIDVNSGIDELFFLGIANEDRLIRAGNLMQIAPYCLQG